MTNYERNRRTQNTLKVSEKKMMMMMRFWIEDQLLAGLNKAMFNSGPKTMSSILFLLLSELGGLYT
jgi:hypothetical protein